MKPYTTAKMLNSYLKGKNKTILRFFIENPFDSREHLDNLRYLAEIKVLSTDTNNSFFKPTKYFNFYLLFHISPYQIFNVYKFIRELFNF